MQYSITKACLLALAAASSVVAQNAGFNVITKPTEGEVVAAGKTYTIEWIPTLPSQDVSLVVLQGASNITLQLGATIASGVPSSAGKYSWSAPADDLFAVYGIKIQLDSNPAVFQYSNQFKVAAASPVVKPNPTTVKVSQVATSAVVATLPAAIVDDIVAEGPKTLTQYETRVQTITSCAPSVADCPYGKVTSTIIPVMPTLSTVIKHETVAANCSCTKGPDGKITSTGTAPVQIPTHYPTTIVVPAPYQNGTITHVAPTVPAPTGGVVVPTPETPAPSPEVPAPSPEAPAPSPEVPAQPEHSPEQEHPYAPIPSAPAPAPAPPAGTAVAPAPPAGTAAPSEAPVPTTPVFTGAAGKVASSLTLVGAAALSLMFL